MPPEEAPVQRTRAAVISRFLLAHVLSLPLAIAWAAAAMPPTIHLYWTVLMGISEMEDVGQFVVRKVAYPAAIAFTLEHLAVIPWLAMRSEARAKRFFVWATAVLYGLGVVVGAAGWIWLLLRD